MKMLNCAGVLFAVLYLVVVWVNAAVIQVCDPNPNEWNLTDKSERDTACDVSVTYDENPDRIPPVLYSMKCTGCGSKCPGNYKCTQLTAIIKVIYKSTQETEDYTLHTGCMCAKQGDPKQATTSSIQTYR